MTYLFAKLGFSVLLCAFVSSFLRMDFIAALAVIFILAVIFSVIYSKKFTDVSAVLSACALGCILIFSELLFDFYPAKGLDGVEAEITGTVKEVSASGGNPVYTVDTDFIDIEGAPQNIKIKISGWDDNSAKPYDIISCRVVFTVYGGENKSDILCDRAGGVSIYAYTKEPFEIIGRDESFPEYHFHQIRDKISSVIYRYFIGWHAPFTEQVIIGTRGELDYSVTNAFRKSGMSHILAISGMHMVIVTGLLEKFISFRKSRRNERALKAGLLMLAVGAYMVIGGLGMSVLRSGFILIIHYASGIFFRGSKSNENLGLAVMIVLFIWPMACCDVGFLMSVISCGAISVFASPLKNFICKKLKTENRYLKAVAEAFSVTFTASLSVLPVSAIAFGEVSVVSVFSNLIAGPFVHISLILGFITVFLGIIPFTGFLAGGTAFIAMISNGIILKIAEFFSSFEFSYIEADSFWITIWMIGSAVLITAPAFYSKSFRYVPYSAGLCAVVFILAVGANMLFYSGVSEINIFALEHGTAVSCSKDGKSVLIVKNLDANDRFDLDFSGNGYDHIISIDALSGAAELELLEKSSPDTAVLSDFSSAERYTGAQNLAPGIYEFSDGANAEIISEGVFCIDFYGTNIIYISEECDIMDIEPKFRRVDIAILDGVSPKDFSNLRCEYMILRQMEGYYSGTTEVITLKDGDIAFFAYNDNIQKGRFAG
ncbi:MAG: ComEC/Rec2 family competence protein [Oscillospiraceae bacterium]|nr:ComEC/Rec2 family competence protein [Oscillospiraceae bacterium]